MLPHAILATNLEKYPEDLENYVLKPLFSFAGSGVLINVTKQDLDAVPKIRKTYIYRKKWLTHLQ